MSFFQPRWAKKMPAHLRPSDDKIERLESLRKHVRVSNKEFHLHIISHPNTTEKALRHAYMLARSLWPDLSNQLILAKVLLQRAELNGMYGGTTFGINVFNTNFEKERQAFTTVSNIQSVEELAKWIVQKEDAANPPIPPASGYDWVLKEISKILEE